MNNVDKAINGAFAVFQKIDGRTVTYQRGDQSVTLTALIDAVRNEVKADGRINRMAAVFTFLKSELDEITPKRTDRIIWNGRTFDVVDGVNDTPVEIEESGEIYLSVYGQQISES